MRLLRDPRWLLTAHLVLPTAAVVHAGPRPLGRSMFDLAGHFWMIWNTGQGAWTRSALLGWPEGVDLLPVVGGWLDIFLGGALHALGADLVHSWNLVMALYVAVAGLGGHALARVAGARPAAAVVAGLLLQLSPLLVDSLNWGRAEQVGVGFVALALAGAVRSWREPRPATAVATGLCGALVLLMCWEYSLLLALFTAGLLPFLLWWSRAPERPPLSASLRAWGLAAAATALPGLPWVATFLHRSLAVRHAEEASFGAMAVQRNSVVLWEWLTHSHLGPAPLLLACLLALPVLAPKRDRRIWIGVGLGLLATLVLSLGPSPTLAGAPAPDTQPRGLFAVVHQLPVLSWFHWPDRYLLAWALALPVAGALVVHRLASLHPAAALVGGALLVGGSAQHLLGKHQWLELGDPPMAPAPLLALRDLPVEGAVLDLPVLREVTLAQRFQLAQMVHGRPILSHGTMAHLLPEDHLDWALDTALADYIADLHGGGRATDPTLADFAPFAERGYRFVVLNPMLGETDMDRARQGLTAALGEPLLDFKQWTLWWIPVEGETRPSMPAVEWPDNRPVMVFPAKPGDVGGTPEGRRLPRGDAAPQRPGEAPPPSDAAGPPPGEAPSQTEREAADERHRKRPRPHSRREEP